MNPSLLGFGAMRLPKDVKECTEMFAAYLDSGGNYIDTAYVYEDSEEMLKSALTSKHPRDRYFLADKLPLWNVKTIEDCDRLLEESLKRCGVDYFDNYLIHAIDVEREKQAISLGVYQWMQEIKKKGLIRHVGFSFHDTPPFLDKVLAAHPEMEFVMLQLNYVDILRGPSKGFHEAALKYKIPLFGMEPIKGGTLSNLPAEAEKLLKAARPDDSVSSWAMRYAASLKGMVCTISGMSTLEQVKDNIKTFNPFEPMRKEEYELLDKVLDILAKEATIPCTGCNYCMSECPCKIEIPGCIAIYNECMRTPDMKFNRTTMYNSIPAEHRSESCTSCGACTERCPQHINIPDALKTVAKEFAA